MKLTTEEFILRSKKIFGEKFDYSLVKYINIGTFLHNYKFKDFKPLPFYFYLIKYNVFIDFDVMQHFESFDFWSGNSRLGKIQISRKN